MERIGQFASRVLLMPALVLTWGALHAQDLPRDGIERNLLQRQQSEREFHVKLYDAPSAAAPKATVTLPLPETFTERESYERAPTTGTGATVTGPAAPDSTVSPRLDDSQARRQLELQIQTRPLDDLARQQQNQIQQSQFGRENQAQDLQQRILRNSNDSMQRLR